MSVDQPTELRYLSTRLANEVVERAGLQTPKPQGKRALAVLASDLVISSTGTLESPREYVLTRLRLNAWILPPKGELPRIGWLVGRLGPVLIVLIGSAENFVDQKPADTHSGWWPSSAMGMHRVVSAYARRPKRGGVLFDLDTSEAREAADWAAYISGGLPREDSYALGTTTVLFRRYADVLDITSAPPFVAPRHFERVFVGAPLAIWSVPANGGEI